MLEKIEKERAEIRQKATQLAGKNVGGSTASVPLNLAEPIEKKGDTREILADKVGIPRTKLETILEVGKLAETGKTKAERDEEEKEERERRS